MTTPNSSGSISDEHYLAERYAAPRTSASVGVMVAAGIVVALFLAWLGWATWVHSTPQVTSQLEGWEAVDGHSATARVAVSLEDGAGPASCLLRATAVDHITVGELRFDVTASGTASYTIRTERLATTVELMGCTTAEQNTPR